MAEPATLQLPADWPAGPSDPSVTHASSSGPDSVVLEIEVPADCPWLEGHFPDLPVLPGVVQLRWALQLAGLIWPEFDTVSAVNNLKFQHPVLPPARLRLELQRNADPARLDFAWYREEQRCSLGRVVFA